MRCGNGVEPVPARLPTSSTLPWLLCPPPPPPSCRHNPPTPRFSTFCRRLHQACGWHQPGDHSSDAAGASSGGGPAGRGAGHHRLLAPLCRPGDRSTAGRCARASPNRSAALESAGCCSAGGLALLLVHFQLLVPPPPPKSLCPARRCTLMTTPGPPPTHRGRHAARLGRLHPAGGVGAVGPLSPAAGTFRAGGAGRPGGTCGPGGGGEAHRRG